MSLLLDALKKAAEQKAEKNRQELAETRGSDETVVDAAAEDVSELEDGGLRQPRRGLRDETEFDDSDYNTRLERSLGGREDGTETRLDAPDQTETRPPSAQMQTGEDETIVFDDEDVSDFMGEPRYVNRETRAGDDETDLSQLAHSEDETEISRVAAQAHGDETDLSQLVPGADETEFGGTAARASGDETDLSQLAHSEDETEMGEAAADAFGDETDLSQLAPGEDETDVSRVAVEAYVDETDLSQLAHREDETEISRLAAKAYGDETDLGQLASGGDETEVGRPAAETHGDETDLGQLASGGDETEVGRPAAETHGDETDLGQLASGGDETEVGRPAAEIQGDETDLSQLAPDDDGTETGEAAAQAGGDDTDLSQLIGPEDQTDLSRLEAEALGDDTDLSQLIAREHEADLGRQAPGDQDEESDFSQLLSREDETGIGGSVADADQTDISVPPRVVADLEQADPGQAAGYTDDTTGGDEDMSLLLVERDQTNLTSPTSATDPQRPAGQIQALQDEAGGDEELALVDTTHHRLPAAADPTQGSATTGVSQDTQTTRSATGRTETSTRTYAPDNYDRTLMRLPSDDASKLFAGMKADSDVVMTPEYAKKVFQSKSSAARMQQYKIYGGIGFAILLVIVVFGLFEFQAEQDSIDNSLRPLKRDPMPGMIRPETESQPTDLFAEVEVDEKTMSLLESAENGETGEAATAETRAAEADETAAEDEGLTGDASVPVEQAQVAEPQLTEMQAAGSDAAAAGQPAQAAAAAAQIAPASAQVSAAASTTATAGSSGERVASGGAADDAPAAPSSSSLRISSSQALEQKQVWLREAYAAYQAGNDEQALRLYNQVLDVDPVNRNALLARAAIHVHNNNAEGAIRDYQKLLLANPRDALALTSLITVANYSPRETETQLKLMLRDDPDSPYLNFALANAYGAQNRWQEAQGHYFAALTNNPDDPNYAYNLAVSLEHISQPRAAAAYYRRALENMGKGLATFSKDVVDQRLEVLGKL